MSQLGKITRDFLIARTGYAANLPGGIHPDTNPVGSVMPYATYQGISRNRTRDITGNTLYTQERIQLTVVAMTRALAQASAQWIADQIKATPSRQSVSSAVIFQWQVEDETSSAEVFDDGTDEAARTVDVDIVGTYKES
jgi:hypothetical protein